MKKIIGISIAIELPKESLFTNGIRQNAISLFHLLQRWDGCEEVYFINFGSQKDLTQSPWQKYSKYILDYETSLTKLNVFLSVTVMPYNNQLDEYRKRGIKLVSISYGAQLSTFVENCLFYTNDTLPEKSKGLFQHRSKFDAVWTSPHLYEKDKDFLSILCKTDNVKICPYIWSPEFVNQHVELNGGLDQVLYKPKPKKKVSCFEPNISIIKNNIYICIIAQLF